jgi:hypothetical protein
MRREFQGYTVELTEEIPGGPFPHDQRGGQLLWAGGPVFWRASRTEADGSVLTFEGGGKVAIDCETGHMVRLLLSPLSPAEPPTPVAPAAGGSP